MQKNNVTTLISGLLLSTVATSAVQASPSSYDGTSIIFDEHYYSESDAGKTAASSASRHNTYDGTEILFDEHYYSESDTEETTATSAVTQTVGSYDGTDILFDEHRYSHDANNAAKNTVYKSFKTLNTSHNTFVTNVGSQFSQR